MLTSQRVAIAAHLHVLLRRKTGRVTDTEWMAENLDYAREIIRFSRAKAVEDNHPELLEWADKLERAVADPSKEPRRPLAQTAVQMIKERKEPPIAPPAESNSTYGESGFAESQL